MLQPEHIRTRSQDLDPIYHGYGQFYWINVETFFSSKSIITSNNVPLIFPETEVQDIDNLEDWALAELKYTLVNKIFFQANGEE